MSTKTLVFMTLLMITKTVSPAYAQEFYRFSADVSIKTKQPDGKMMLVVGTVFFDKNEKKTVYAINFPYKEYWIQEDTILYKVVEDTIQSSSNVSIFEGSNLYEIMLNQKLGDFGLDETYYEVIDISNKGTSVVTTLKPKPPADLVISGIKLETVNGLIDKVTIYDIEGKVAMVQKFSNYLNIRGLNIPSELLKVIKKENNTQTELITLSNIQLNDFENNALYQYPVPQPE